MRDTVIAEEGWDNLVILDARKYCLLNVSSSCSCWYDGNVVPENTIHAAIRLDEKNIHTVNRSVAEHEGDEDENNDNEKTKMVLCIKLCGIFV